MREIGDFFLGGGHLLCHARLQRVSTPSFELGSDLRLDRLDTSHALALSDVGQALVLRHHLLVSYTRLCGERGIRCSGFRVKGLGFRV